MSEAKQQPSEERSLSNSVNSSRWPQGSCSSSGSRVEDPSSQAWEVTAALVGALGPGKPLSGNCCFLLWSRRSKICCWVEIGEIGSERTGPTVTQVKAQDYVFSWENRPWRAPLSTMTPWARRSKTLRWTFTITEGRSELREHLRWALLHSPLS